MTHEELGQRLVQLGIVPADVASMLDVNPRTVRAWLTGRDPVPDWLVAEVEAWELRVQQLRQMDPDELTALADAARVNSVLARVALLK